MGSIQLGSLLGDRLYDLAREECIKICLEIGTGYGTGSTYCIAKGLKETSGILFTIEADPEIMKKAMDSLKKHYFPIFFLLGTAMSSEYLKDWNNYEQEINTNKYLPSSLLSEMKMRYLDQKPYYSRKESGALLELCKHINCFDLVFLDGGTFTSYDEMVFLQNKIGKYLIIDDTNYEKGGRKNVKTRIELIKSDKFEVLEDHYEDRTGWMLLKRPTNNLL